MGIYLKGLDFYPALISREGDKYLARFVDIPNCIAFGASAMDAEVNAAHALASHCRFLGDHGLVLPGLAPISEPNQGRDGYVAYVKLPVDQLDAAAGAAIMPLAKAA